MLLSDAIGHYKADRLAKGFKKGTVRGEQTTLRELLACAGNIQVASLAPRHIDALFYRKQDLWSAGTFNKSRAHLSAFFKWCRVRGYMDRFNDPLEGTRNRKVTPTDRQIIPVSEFPAVLDAAGNGRDRIVMALGLYLFVRVSETSAIRWQHINFDEAHRGTDKWKPTVDVYRRKTEDYDTLPMAEELYLELRKWRLEYGAAVGEVPKPGWFVAPGRTPPRFSGSANGLVRIGDSQLLPTTPLGDVTKVVRRVLGRAGYLSRGEGGHTLRRSGATALYHQLSSVGHDRAIRMCQAMLGHVSIETTEVYLRLDLDRKARNDLLAGKPMFPGAVGAVLKMDGGKESGEADTGLLRL